jgi:putative tricarboxylic transport membrane protein
VLERRLSKHPEEFGHGAIEGVAGPETANNASTSGAFVPLLSLGIAGSDTTAILLGAFVLWGIQPGPLLMVQHPDLVWGVISSMYFGNVMLLILNLPLVFVFARMLAIPMAVLLPTIVVIAAAGTYPVTNSTFQLYLLLGFGIFGYILKRFSVPLTPLLLALVLGDMMEQSFRQAMTITSGDPAIFVTSPISAVLLLIGLLFLFGPALASRFRGHPSAAATDA